MKVKKTKIKDLLIIEPRIYNDSRGFFFESYNQKIYDKSGIESKFVQDNESFSKRGTLRGFHFQKPPHAQSKLVRCSFGKVLDIAIDIRLNSPTYGHHVKVILSDKNKKQFYIPNGFAHAFLVLSDYAIFNYKVDNFYNPSSDSGIFWDDPSLNIDWGIDKSEIITSKKDSELKLINDLNSPFI
tara:strand:+ start:1800 stop:2351 length:552 start_codon:yes stop_codon:yes gene_type:complete